MKIKSTFLQRFHLDPRHMLLSTRNAQIVWELFQAMDIHNQRRLDDVQFLAFMKNTTNLSESHIYLLFDTFDVDASGAIEFDEFYLLFCMLVAIKVLVTVYLLINKGWRSKAVLIQTLTHMFFANRRGWKQAAVSE